MSTDSLIRTLPGRALKVADKLGFLAPALIRLTVGLVFIRTGWGKLHSLDQVTEFFAGLHIPLPAFNAHLVAATELVGGALILVGLGARLVALPLAFTMVIAIITARLGDVGGPIDLVGLEEWSYLVMFLAVAIAGPGALSVDALLIRRLKQPGRLGSRLGQRNGWVRSTPVTGAQVAHETEV